MIIVFIVVIILRIVSHSLETRHALSVMFPCHVDGTNNECSSSSSSSSSITSSHVTKMTVTPFERPCRSGKSYAARIAHFTALCVIQ